MVVRFAKIGISRKWVRGTNNQEVRCAVICLRLIIRTSRTTPIHKSVHELECLTAAVGVADNSAGELVTPKTEERSE